MRHYTLFSPATVLMTQLQVRIVKTGQQRIYGATLAFLFGVIVCNLGVSWWNTRATLILVDKVPFSDTMFNVYFATSYAAMVIADVLLVYLVLLLQVIRKQLTTHYCKLWRSYVVWGGNKAVLLILSIMFTAEVGEFQSNCYVCACYRSTHSVSYDKYHPDVVSQLQIFYTCTIPDGLRRYCMCHSSDNLPHYLVLKADWDFKWSRIIYAYSWIKIPTHN